AAAAATAPAAWAVHVVVSAAATAVTKAAAVGQHDVVDAAHGVLALRLMNEDSDDVAGRHRRLRPANQAQSRRTAQLRGPVHRLAFVILHVELEDGVGVGPRELRYRRILERDRAAVVGSVAM